MTSNQLSKERPPSPRQAAQTQAGLGMILPSMPDAKALTISVGIIGATVMPHAVYLQGIDGILRHVGAEALLRDDGTLQIVYSNSLKSR